MQELRLQIKHIRESLRARNLTGLYLFGFTILLTISALYTTKIKYLVIGGTGLYLYKSFDYVCIIGIIFAFTYVILSGRYRWWELLAVVLSLAAAAWTAHVSQNHLVAWMIVAVVCAKGISAKHIIRIYIVIECFILGLACFLAYEGVIKQVIVVTHGVVRYALGTLHPNNLGAHIIYLCLALSFLRRNRLSLFDISIDVVALIVCYIIPHSRAAIFALIVLIVVTAAAIIIGKLKPKGLTTRSKKILIVALSTIPFICATISLGVLIGYDPTNPILVQLDARLSHRLAEGHLAFEMYKITPLGQYLELHNRVGRFKDFTIDNWYLRSLLEFGFITFFAAMAALTSIYIRSYRHNIVWLAVIMSIISVYSMSEAFMLQLGYNVFMAVLLTDLHTSQRQRYTSFYPTTDMYQEIQSESSPSITGAGDTQHVMPTSAHIDITYIVSVYNAMTLLDNTIDSLVGQAYAADRMELIFVDDGSTDGSAERLDAIAASRPTIRVVHIPHSGGPGRPRNIGLDQARGEYVFFCCVGDYLDRQATALMLQHARAWNSDMLIVRITGENGYKVARGVYEMNLPRADVYRVLCRSLEPWRLYRRNFLITQKLRFVEGCPDKDYQAFVIQALLCAPIVSVAVDKNYYHAIRQDDMKDKDIRSDMRISTRTDSTTRASYSIFAYENARTYIFSLFDMIERYADRKQADIELIPLALGKGLYEVARTVGQLEASLRSDAFEELRERLCAYVQESTYLVLDARDGLMLRAFVANDLDSWLEICLNPEFDYCYNTQCCTFDDEKHTAMLVWESSYGKVYELDAIGRYTTFEHGLNLCAWHGDKLRLGGTIDARDLYGLKEIALCVKRRWDINYSAMVPLSVSLPTKAISRERISWQIELSPDAFGSFDNQSNIYDWDYFIRASYSNGYSLDARLSCQSLLYKGIPYAPQHLKSNDVVALYATGSNNLSMILLAHDPHFVLTDKYGKTFLTLAIPYPPSNKKHSSVLVFQHNNKLKAECCTANIPKHYDFKLLDIHSHLRWKISAYFEHSGALSCIPLDVKNE